jgi:hypothetical protein
VKNSRKNGDKLLMMAVKYLMNRFANRGLGQLLTANDKITNQELPECDGQ